MKDPGPYPFLVLAALSVVALIAPGAVGQSSQRTAPVKPTPQGADLQHEVAVTLKLIQVFVTDAEGKPVLDLEKSDFVIIDNGKPQTITDFERHVEGPTALEKPALAPSSPREAAPLLSRKFFFIIDYIRNDRKGRHKVAGRRSRVYGHEGQAGRRDRPVHAVLDERADPARVSDEGP
jgi:hypothetical protein